MRLMKNVETRNTYIISMCRLCISFDLNVIERYMLCHMLRHKTSNASRRGSIKLEKNVI